MKHSVHSAKAGACAPGLADAQADGRAGIAGDDAIAKAIARERALIGAELHDTLVQSLVHMKLRLSLLEDALGADRPGRVAEHVAELREALNRAYAEARELLTRFRGSLDPRGLVGTLRAVGDKLQALTGIAFTIEDRAGGLALGADRDLQVFLIIQELVANIGRHAHAKSALVLLERDAGTLRITVDDDGRGMGSESASAGHHGIGIMRERAVQIGGQLTFSTRVGGGTRARLLIPLSGAE